MALKVHIETGTINLTIEGDVDFATIEPVLRGALGIPPIGNQAAVDALAWRLLSVSNNLATVVDKYKA
jgi:hypothetical protein